jgi:D-alanyl-D-alanine carboxypeptidase
MFKNLLPITIALALLGSFLTTPASAATTDNTRLVGKLTAITGKTLILAGENGATVTVTCNDATKYRRDANSSFVTIAELAVGQTLRVYYGPNKVASLVNITSGNNTGATPGANQPQPTRLVGKLTAITGKTLTIAGENGTTVTVTCNDATKYRRDATNSPAKSSDLKVNQILRVYYGADKIAGLVNIVKEP